MVFYSKHCATLLMASLCGSSQAGNNVEVDWVIPQDGVLPNMKAKVGDTAIFNWGGFHNVLIHPSGNCDEEGAIDVGETSGASYTFEEKDVGEVVFACDVGSHCEFGQIVTFEVKGPDNGDTVSIQEPTATSGGCYDTDVHVCGCDLDACDEAKCTAKGRLWTDECPTHCDAEACAAGIEEKEEDPMNILGTLEASGNFGTLLGAIESTGLTDILNGDGPFTIFAPTDSAFSLITVPSDMDTLKTLLLNHVAGEMVTSAALLGGRTTLEMVGGEVATANTEGTIAINGAPITLDYFDVMASNGVIHGISGVMAFTTDEESSSQEEQMASEEKEMMTSDASKESMEDADPKGAMEQDNYESSAVSFRLLRHGTLLSAFVACVFMM